MTSERLNHDEAIRPNLDNYHLYQVSGDFRKAVEAARAIGEIFEADRNVLGAEVWYKNSQRAAKRGDRIVDSTGYNLATSALDRLKSISEPA